MKKRKRIGIIILVIIIIGMLIPQNLKIPVSGATKSDYNLKSFWYYPWGESVTHKGVNVFAKKNTEINSATLGLVLYSGEINLGGKFVLIIDPKWRLYYYAHLNKLKTISFSFVNNKS